MEENNVLNTPSTSEQKPKKEKRIVRRSWVKITIIVVTVIILLTGLSVGLYFAFRPTPWNDNGIELKDGNDANAVRNSIANGGDNNEGVAIFFYEEEDAVANWLLFNDENGPDGDNASDGPLKKYVNYDQADDTTTWYGVNLSSKKSENWVSNFFIENNDKENAQFYDSLDNDIVGAPTSYGVDYWDSWSYNPETDGANDYLPTNSDYQADTKIKLKIQDDNSEKDEWDWQVYWDTDSANTKVSKGDKFTVESGTFMFFDGEGGFEAMIQSVTNPTWEEDAANDSAYNETGDQFKEWLKLLTNWAVEKK